MAQIADNKIQPQWVTPSTDTHRMQFLLLLSIVLAFGDQAVLLRTNGDDPREALINLIVDLGDEDLHIMTINY